MEELSADEARRLFLWAQGLMGPADRKPGAVDRLLRTIGLVQLDTISVLARSHELVPYARLGAVGRPAVEAAYWSRPAKAFEYWAHAACVIPIEDWPWMAIRRREYLGPQRQRIATSKTYREVLARLADGPTTATDLGGAKRGGPWWDWSDVKIAVEQLLHAGIVACVERRGWKRVYDLTERVIPAGLLAVEPTEQECRIELVRRAARHLGVGTRADLADYYRLKVSKMAAPLADAGLVPVRVKGWDPDQPAWADPAALDALRSGRVRGRHRTTLLSPFDPIVWHRSRTARVFGFDYLFEAYVPPAKRAHGYFTMPVLSGGRLVARVDPGRQGRTLVAKHVILETPAAAEPTMAALAEAAAWVGADNVVVERVTSP
ncbi:MAG: uncharacterized protein QOF60_1484 [Actinomycetota bacterium]|jgi:uncharacterized protein YcaQ|nr:uncharacterized protein [Actinomycetota bacterium]